MLEPDVTLSDYAIAIITLVFTVLILRAPARNRQARGWLALIFFGVAAGAVLGGTVHGFLNVDKTSLSHFIVWRATLISVGVTALGGWGFGSSLLLKPSTARTVRILAVLSLLVYAAIIVFFTQQFRVAIIYYLPAALFLLYAFGRIAWRDRTWTAFTGFIGVLLSFLAAIIQQAHITIHPVYLTHNTLYHLIQIIGLYLIFRGGKWAIARG